MKKELDLVGVIGEFEYSEKVTFWDSRGDYHDFAQTVVRKSALKIPYGGEQSVVVRIFQLSIDKGQLKRTFVKTMTILVPSLPPTDQQFQDELSEVLSELPKEFHCFVSSNAYENGHSSGYVDILNVARELVYHLKPAIIEYTKRITG